MVDVEEALRLFKVSTLAASQAHPSLMEAGRYEWGMRGYEGV